MACYKTITLSTPPWTAKVKVPCPKPKGTNKYGGPKGTKKDKYGNPLSVHKGRDVGGFLGGGGTSRTGGGGNSKRSKGGSGGGSSGNDARARKAENDALYRARQREIERKRIAAQRRLKKEVEQAAKKRQKKVDAALKKQEEARQAIKEAQKRIQSAKTEAEARTALAAKLAAQHLLTKSLQGEKAAERKARAEAAAKLTKKKNSDKFGEKTPYRPAQDGWTRAEKLRHRRKRRKKIAETKKAPALIPDAKFKRGEAGYGKDLRRRMRIELALQKQHPELFDQKILDDIGKEIILHQELMRLKHRELSMRLRVHGREVKKAMKAGDTKRAKKAYKAYLDLADEKELNAIKNEFRRLYGREALTVGGKLNKKKFKMGITEEFAYGVEDVFDARMGHVQDKLFGTGLVGGANKLMMQVGWAASQAYVNAQAYATRKNVYDPKKGYVRKQTITERLIQMAKTGELDKFGDIGRGADARVNFGQRALLNRNDIEFGSLYERLEKAGIEDNVDVTRNSAVETLVRRQIVPQALDDAWEAFKESDLYVVPGVDAGIFDADNYGMDGEGEFFIDQDGNKLRHGDEIQGGFVPHWGVGRDRINDWLGWSGNQSQAELNGRLKAATKLYEEQERQRIEDKLWGEVGMEDPGFIADAMKVPIAGEVVMGLDAFFGITSHEVRKKTLTEYGADLGNVNPKLATHLSRAAGKDPREDPDFPGQDLLQEFLGIPIRTVENVTGAAEEAGLGPAKILYNMIDAVGKTVTLPVNAIVFPAGETVGRIARGEDLIHEYADKDEEGLVTAAFAIAGWAGVGATMSKVEDEDGEGIRYDVTFEAGGVPVSFSFGKGENVERRIKREQGTIAEAWGTGDWGVIFETISVEGEFFKEGNLSGGLNLLTYLIYDPTNWVAPLSLAKRGIHGYRHAVAMGLAAPDPKLVSLSQKVKAFREGFSINPGYYEARAAAFEDLQQITGMNEEDAMELLQRTLLQMDEGNDPVESFAKILEAMGLDRETVNVRQLHGWVEEHIRTVMRDMGLNVHTQTDRALAANRIALIEGGGNYRMVKARQRQLAKELEEYNEAKRAMNQLRKQEAADAAKAAAKREQNKMLRVVTEPGPAVPKRTKKIKVKKTVTERTRIRVRKTTVEKPVITMRQMRKAVKKRRLKKRPPNTYVGRTVSGPESPIAISRERGLYSPLRGSSENLAAAKQARVEYTKYIDSGKATYGEVNAAIASDMERAAGIRRKLRLNQYTDPEKMKERAEQLDARVVRRNKQLAARKANKKDLAEQTTQENIAEGAQSRRLSQKEYAERMARNLRAERDAGAALKKGKLTEAQYRQVMDAIETDRRVATNLYHGANDAQAPSQFRGASKVERTIAPEGKSAGIKAGAGVPTVRPYEQLFDDTGDQFYGSAKPSVRAKEDALTRQIRMERIEANKPDRLSTSGGHEVGVFDTVPGLNEIWWHPDNPAVNHPYAIELRNIIMDGSQPWDLRYAKWIELNSYSKKTNALLIRGKGDQPDGFHGAYDRTLAGVGDSGQKAIHTTHQQAVADAITRTRRTKKTPDSARLVLDEDQNIVHYIDREAAAEMDEFDKLIRNNVDSIDQLYDDVVEVGSLGEALEPYLQRGDIYDFYSPLKPFDPEAPMATRNPKMLQVQDKVSDPLWRAKMDSRMMNSIMEDVRVARLGAMEERLAHQLDAIDEQISRLRDQQEDLLNLAYGDGSIAKRPMPSHAEKIDSMVDAIEEKIKNLKARRDAHVRSVDSKIAKVKAGEKDAPLGNIAEFKESIQPFYDLFHKLASTPGDHAAKQLRLAHDRMVNRVFSVMDDGTVEILWHEDIAISWLLMESRYGLDYALAPDVIEQVMWKMASKRGLLPGHVMGMFNPSYGFRAPARFTALKARFDKLMDTGFGGHMLERWIPKPGAKAAEVKAVMLEMGNVYHGFHREWMAFNEAGKKLPFDRMMRGATAAMEGQVFHWQNWVPFRKQATEHGNVMKAAFLNNATHEWVRNTFDLVDGRLKPKNDAVKLQVEAVYQRYIKSRKADIRRVLGDIDDEKMALELRGELDKNVWLEHLTESFTDVQEIAGHMSQFVERARRDGTKFHKFPPAYGSGARGRNINARGVSDDILSAIEMSWGAGDIPSSNPMEEIFFFVTRSQWWDDKNLGMSLRFVERMDAWGYQDEVRDFLRIWHRDEFAGIKSTIASFGDQPEMILNTLVEAQMNTQLGRLLRQVEGDAYVLELKKAAREQGHFRRSADVGEQVDASSEARLLEDEQKSWQAERPDYANPQEVSDHLVQIDQMLRQGDVIEQRKAIWFLKELMRETIGATGQTDTVSMIRKLREDKIVSEQFLKTLIEEIDLGDTVRATPQTGPASHIIEYRNDSGGTTRREVGLTPRVEEVKDVRDKYVEDDARIAETRGEIVADVEARRVAEPPDATEAAAAPERVGDELGADARARVEVERRRARSSRFTMEEVEEEVDVMEAVPGTKTSTEYKASTERDRQIHYQAHSVETIRMEPGPPILKVKQLPVDPVVMNAEISKAIAGIMGLSEEDFARRIIAKNNALKKTGRLSVHQKILLNKQSSDARKVIAHVKKLKKNGYYEPPWRRFLSVHKKAYKLRKRMEGVIPPKVVAYWAETVEQIDTETARAINVKYRRSYVAVGGPPIKDAEDFPIAEYSYLDQLVTAEIHKVQAKRRSAIGLKPIDDGKPQPDIMATVRDTDPDIIAARQRALDQFYRDTGFQVSADTYERVRTLLAPHYTRRARTDRLMKEARIVAAKRGTSYRDEFLRLRKRDADKNARLNVAWTMFENPHMDADDAADMVSLSWYNDGTIRNDPTEMYEFDAIIYKKAFAELTGGADLDDSAQRLAALNAHGTTPPMDKKHRFRTHQENNGEWSPRAVDTVINRGAWSVDKERAWWDENYGMRPEWLGSIIDEDATYYSLESYTRAMQSTNNYDDSIVRNRMLAGEQNVSFHDLAWGVRDDQGNWIIRPQKDIEVERQYAFERYGTRVADQMPDGTIRFKNMPWLMTQEEYIEFSKVHPDQINNLIPPEAVDAVNDAIANITRKHIDQYMSSHWSAGVTEVDPAMVHAIAFEMVRELASTVPWQPFVKNLRNRKLLDVWSSLWRASILSNPAFVLSNMIDTPTKGILFKVTDDMLGSTDKRAHQFIRGLGDIGRGQGSAYLYSKGSRPLMERLSSETTYGKLDRATAFWDAATTGLARATLQPIEDTVKLGLARDYYSTLRWGTGKTQTRLNKLLRGKIPDETVFDYLIRQGASEEQADMLLKLEVQRKIDKMFPTLESAGLGERILNKVFPFISYNLKNKLVWVAWALDHPMMTRAFIAMQESITEHNRNEFMEKHGIDPDSPDANFLPEHLFHQIKIGDDFYLDISNFTDAARGMRPLVDPGGGYADFGGFLQNFFRPLPSQRAAWDAALWYGFGIGGRLLWDREFDADGNWTGGYVKRIAPPLTPWGRPIADLNEYIWPLEYAQTLMRFASDGEFDDREVVRIYGDLLLFSGLSEPSETYMLNLQYRKLLEVSETGAREWLQNTEAGQRLVQLWRESFYEGSTTKLNEFALIPMEDENGNYTDIPTAEEIRAVFRKNMDPEDRDKMFQGWQLIQDIGEAFDVAIDGITDKKLIDEMWTARRTLVANIYARNPMMGFYEGMGMDPKEYSMYTQNFVLDQKAKQFFEVFGAGKVPTDPDEAEKFYEEREAYLRANKDLTDYLWREASTASRVEQNIVDDYKEFFKQDVLVDGLIEAFEARDWQKGEEAARAAKDFSSLALDVQGLVQDEDGRWQLIQKNIIGRLKAGDETATYGLRLKAAWEQSKGDPLKWWNIMDKSGDLKEMYFGKNPEKRATWEQDGKYYRFWGRFGRLADKGKWDQAWDSWDNAPEWMRQRMRESNPKKFRELERSSRYSTYMGNWVALFEAGKPQQAMAYFHSLPRWVKERYYENNPGKRFGTTSQTAGRGSAYVTMLDGMFNQIDAGNWDAAERIWRNAPAWMRRRYYANNPDSTLFRGKSGGSYKSYGSGGSSGGGISDAKYRQYIKMMKKWVDIMRDGGDAKADAYFRKLPKWAQDFYLARHKDKALLKEDMAMQRLLMDFFTANKATRESMKKNNPALMKWLQENSSAAARKNALNFLYSRLPDDPWIKRVFREKYPEVFSPEAKGKETTDKVAEILSQHPSFIKDWMKWYQDIHATLLEAMKWSTARPKSYEVDRPTKRRYGESLSAEETSKQVQATVRQVQELNKRMPAIE